MKTLQQECYLHCLDPKCSRKECCLQFPQFVNVSLPNGWWPKDHLDSISLVCFRFGNPLKYLLLIYYIELLCCGEPQMEMSRKVPLPSSYLSIFCKLSWNKRPQNIIFQRNKIYPMHLIDSSHHHKKQNKKKTKHE